MTKENILEAAYIMPIIILILIIFCDGFVYKYKNGKLIKEYESYKISYYFLSLVISMILLIISFANLM